MSEEKPPLLEFPCNFPIKLFGLNQAGLETLILAIVRSHVPDITADALSSRLSKGGKYTAVTITVCAQSQSQLDAIYRDLTACVEIVMAL
jgi:putative lipoic acid-binding regulatory protein